MKKFTDKQLQELLTAQRSLNEKYTGKDWMKIVPLESFLVAVQTEVSEFYESAPRVSNWKFWKKNEVNDTQNMIIETIDVVHFALSALMYNASDETIISLNGELINSSNNIEGSAKNILIGQTHFISASFEGSAEKSLFAFYGMINEMSVASGRTMTEIYNGYFKKNELNHKRVDGGYQEGNYNKIDTDGSEDNRQLSV